MNDFNELLDDNANWAEEPPRDTCPMCDGNGGWYIDEQGDWSIAPSGYGDDMWADCAECGGLGEL
jgi:hypothetical protein